jgi:osmotically-inducible protein OsmY
MSDNTLQRAILDELNWDPQVEPGHIGVTARNGVATLTGHVGSYVQKHAAERAASRVKGVTAVANEIEVQLPDDFSDTDETLAERASHVLAWDSSMAQQDIKVVVDHGWVTLTGVVDWAFQRQSAEHDVHRIHGVVGIRNLITVRARPATGAIKQQIAAALKRHAELDASKITVSAEDGKVVLDGKVHCCLERNLAEQAAWSAPGVTAVIDRIHVQ